MAGIGLKKRMQIVAGAGFFLGLAGLTGCGLGTSAPDAGMTSANLQGKLYGGPNPVVGATVTLYATASNGYGGAATQLAQTTTDSHGSFSSAARPTPARRGSRLT